MLRRTFLAFLSCPDVSSRAAGLRTARTGACVCVCVCVCVFIPSHSCLWIIMILQRWQAVCALVGLEFRASACMSRLGASLHDGALCSVGRRGGSDRASSRCIIAVENSLLLSRYWAILHLHPSCLGRKESCRAPVMSVSARLLCVAYLNHSCKAAVALNPKPGRDDPEDVKWHSG